MSSFQQKILSWFDKNGRHDLPWQTDSNPYKVWISEIMLQQTQVSTVIPYFQRFIKRFPNVQTLALAPIDSVLALWTGLGYYSRARNCHQAAKIIHTEFQNGIPNTLEELLALPGIGRSTAGAILALGFQKQYPILDGNVKRVLCRYFAIEGWPGIPAITQHLWDLSTKLTPLKRVHHYTQAMMDLGATLCTRTKPKCSECPIKTKCKAHQQNSVPVYPAAKPKTEKQHQKIYMLILSRSTPNQALQVLLEHRTTAGIWNGLWSFPECASIQSSKRLMAWIQTHFGYTVKTLQCWEPFCHTLTHKYLDIHPIHAELQFAKRSCSKSNTASNFYWHTLGSQLNRGVSTPIKRLLIELENKLDEEILNKVK